MPGSSAASASSTSSASSPSSGSGLSSVASTSSKPSEAPTRLSGSSARNSSAICAVRWRRPMAARLPAEPIPAGEILRLLGRELVYLHTERIQLQPRDLALERRRDLVHALLERAGGGHEVHGRERQQGERDVHHGGRVALGGGQVHDPPLREQVEPLLADDELLHERPDLAVRARDGGEPADVDLHVEVACVG